MSYAAYDIDWMASGDPVSIVGKSPDGGFYVHASLHPYGVQGASLSAEDAGVRGREHATEVYFPLPWIRAEIDRAKRNGMRAAAIASLEKTEQVLNKTLSAV
jgi:hypothetical protein